MTENKPARELPKPLENFTRGLLATTCLTMACGVSATAGTITEGTPPAPTDFPNSAPPYVLPSLTNVVTGFIGSNYGEGANPNFDSADWFEFTGLTPGGSYQLSGQTLGVDPFDPSRFAENGMRVNYYNTSNGSLGSLDIGEAGGGIVTNTFTAPSDGNLVVDVSFADCSGCLSAWTSNADPYTVTLTGELGSATPEPGTVGAVGVGLGAVALAWRRRRAG